MALESVFWLVALSFSFAVLLSTGIDINGHSGAEEPECAHEYLDQYRDGPEIHYAAGVAEVHVRQKRQSAKGLRIRPFYDATIDQLDDQIRNVLKGVVNYATEYFKKTLVARSTLEPIIYSRGGCGSRRYCTPQDPVLCPRPKCGWADLPESHFAACIVCSDSTGQNCAIAIPRGPGVPDADYAVYISANESIGCTGSFLGFSHNCYYERGLDRPVAGAINFCVKNLRRYPLETWRSLAKHEMVHLLGFIPPNYAFFRDHNGNPLTPRHPITNLPTLGIDRSRRIFIPSTNTILTETVEKRSITGRHMFNVTYMVTPCVQMEARRHFNCSSLKGLELEDRGSIVTSFSHWKRRIFQEEGMTGSIHVNAAFSRLTLALLEDTGWYNVNFSCADPLRYGLNLGCDFAQKSCYSFGLSNDPYCSEIVSSAKPGNLPHFSGYNTKCTYDRTSLARCDLIQHTTPVPPQYQYFLNAYEGGRYQTADYCPRRTGFRWCPSSLNQPSSATNVFAETFSPQSGCIEWEILKNWIYQGAQMQPAKGSGCYQHYCTDSHVVITVQGKNHTCLMPGQRILVDQTRTSSNFSNVMYLKCPPYEDMCWPRCSRTCLNGGTCCGVNKCCCRCGWEGQYCEMPHRKKDLLFMIDSSNYLSNNAFELEKRLAVNLLDSLEICENQTHVAVINYTADVEIEFNFTAFHDLNVIKRRITNMMRLGQAGARNTIRGLDTVTNLFANSGRGLSHATRTLILLTDGRNREGIGKRALKRAIEELETNGIVRIAIGFEQKNSKFLKKITGSPSRVFHVKKAKQLMGVISSVAALIK